MLNNPPFETPTSVAHELIITIKYFVLGSSGILGYATRAVDYAVCLSAINQTLFRIDPTFCMRPCRECVTDSLHDSFNPQCLKINQSVQIQEERDSYTVDRAFIFLV